MVLGRWIITCPTGETAAVSAPAMTMLADDPAILCTSARVCTPWRDAFRSRLYISKPANTEPPPELISSTNSSPSGFCASAPRMSAGQLAGMPHQRRIGASPSDTM